MSCLAYNFSIPGVQKLQHVSSNHVPVDALTLAPI